MLLSPTCTRRVGLITRQTFTLARVGQPCASRRAPRKIEIQSLTITEHHTTPTYQYIRIYSYLHVLSPALLPRQIKCPAPPRPPGSLRVTGEPSAKPRGNETEQVCLFTEQHSRTPFFLLALE